MLRCPQALAYVGRSGNTHLILSARGDVGSASAAGGDASSTDELGSRASLKDLEIALHAFTNAGREAKFECAAGVGLGSVDNRGSR